MATGINYQRAIFREYRCGFTGYVNFRSNLLGGGIVVLILLLYRIFSLYRFFSKQSAYVWRNYKVIESEQPLPTFSFFHYIFIGQAQQYNHLEKEAILQHESTHAKYGHTFDILLVNIASVICWFNPVLMIYKKARM
jgi:bla regulator protein BlaR1